MAQHFESPHIFGLLFCDLWRSFSRVNIVHDWQLIIVLGYGRCYYKGHILRNTNEWTFITPGKIFLWHLVVQTNMLESKRQYLNWVQQTNHPDMTLHGILFSWKSNFHIGHAFKAEPQAYSASSFGFMPCKSSESREIALQITSYICEWYRFFFYGQFMSCTYNLAHFHFHIFGWQYLCMAMARVYYLT